MSEPLWTPTNKTLFSSIFTVPAGDVCVLFASGFSPYAYRVDPEKIQYVQAACVRRVLHGYKMPLPDNTVCGSVFDITTAKGELIVDELVRDCGTPWQLSQCRNIGIIGVPGVYRLELNDSTAVGVVQIYAEFYNANDIPAQVADTFF